MLAFPRFLEQIKPAGHLFLDHEKMGSTIARHATRGTPLDDNRLQAAYLVSQIEFCLLPALARVPPRVPPTQKR